MQSAVEKIVSLTPVAVQEAWRRLEEKAKNLNSSDDVVGLRLGVKGGGCSGLSYLIKIDKAQESDYVMDCYGFPIFIDTKSSLYLKGVVLDYDGGFMGNGFKFINPNASNTCGCGESFSL